MTHVCLVLLCMGADVYTDFLERGNAAYAAGDMRAAVASYGELVASGVENPGVFHNLGSAYYHLGDPGRAVLNFERALGLDPGFGAARRALEALAEEAANPLGRPGGFALAGYGASLVPGVPRLYFRWGLAGLWALLWGILAAIHRKRPARPWRTAAPVCALLVLCGVALGLPDSPVRSAVVVAPEAPARYGPDSRDAVRRTLAAGDRVLVDHVAGGWTRVETADGTRGWVRGPSLAYLGPPFDIDSRETEIDTP